MGAVGFPNCNKGGSPCVVCPIWAEADGRHSGGGDEGCAQDRFGTVCRSVGVCRSSGGRTVEGAAHAVHSLVDGRHPQTAPDEGVHRPELPS